MTLSPILPTQWDPPNPFSQKPYFQLLYDALAPGGHISTQGECLWIHLKLIKKDMCQTLFAQAEYVFTTIPTYSSGQIGLMVCAKNASNDLKMPLRSLKGKGCRYYNEDVHRAAFVRSA